MNALLNMKKVAATLASSAVIIGTLLLLHSDIDDNYLSTPNQRRLKASNHLPVLIGDPKTVDLRADVPWEGTQNAQVSFNLLP